MAEDGATPIVDPVDPTAVTEEENTGSDPVVDDNPPAPDTAGPEADETEDDATPGDVMAELAALKAQLNKERADVENDKAKMKTALSDIDKMKAELKKASGMDEPIPVNNIPNQLRPGYDYEAPTFSEICKLVGKEFADTLKAFAKLKNMSAEEREKWACKSWNHIIHTQDYYEERAIVKYKTWVRNLRNVQLSL